MCQKISGNACLAQIELRALLEIATFEAFGTFWAGFEAFLSFSSRERIA